MALEGRAVKVGPWAVEIEDDGVSKDGKAERTRGIVDVRATKPLGPYDRRVEETVMGARWL